MEVEAGTPEAKRMIELLHDAYGWEIREDSGIGIKPVSQTGHSVCSRLPSSTPCVTTASGFTGCTRATS